MSAKNVSFVDKKIKKSDFYKNKKVTNIDDIDVDKILVSNEERCGVVQKTHLNILLNTGIMVLLDHYPQSFYKWLAMLENFKLTQQHPLRLMANNS